MTCSAVRAHRSSARPAQAQLLHSQRTPLRPTARPRATSTPRPMMSVPVHRPRRDPADRPVARPLRRASAPPTNASPTSPTAPAASSSVPTGSTATPADGPGRAPGMAAKGRTPTPRLNPASAARAGKLVIALSLAAAFAGCAGTRVATVYLPSVCVDDQQRPELISRACATGQVGIDKIHWIGWGSPRAVGHGFAYHNDCRPACNGDSPG